MRWESIANRPSNNMLILIKITMPRCHSISITFQAFSSKSSFLHEQKETLRRDPGYNIDYLTVVEEACTLSAAFRMLFTFLKKDEEMLLRFHSKTTEVGAHKPYYLLTLYTFHIKIRLLMSLMSEICQCRGSIYQ